MARRRSYTPEQTITKLREAEVLLGQGKTVKEASKLLEISEQTYCRCVGVAVRHKLETTNPADRQFFLK